MKPGRALEVTLIRKYGLNSPLCCELRRTIKQMNEEPPNWTRKNYNRLVNVTNRGVNRMRLKRVSRATYKKWVMLAADGQSIPRRKPKVKIEGVSAVILNWRRPGNVRQIARRLADWGMDVTVWNNWNEPFKCQVGRVINSSEDFGLYSRFAAALLCPNPVIWMQDDDLLLDRKTADEMLAELRRRSEAAHRVVGVYGRDEKPDGSYARNRRGNFDVDVALTRVCCFKQELAAHFFQHCHRFDHIQNGSRPYGNGEDILLNYVAQYLTGCKNRVIHAAPKELPAPHAIHARTAGHQKHRTKLMRACREWVDSK